MVRPGERGEGRHPLEGLARAVAVHRLEMVEAPGAVEAELLGELDAADDLVPGQALLGNVESEAHLTNLAACCTSRSNTIAAWTSR